jgi:high affinity Mn2+ porin
MNWALANSAAWDYPADTFGYTWGLAAEYHAPAWAVRAGAAAEPRLANQVELDRRIGRTHGFAIEGEHQSPWEDHKGAFRLLFYFNEARMGNYDQAVALSQRAGTPPAITTTRADGHSKYGFTSSDDVQLTERLGAFSRLSWDDGRNETWAYDEVDGSAALGLDWSAAAWDRPQDHLAVAQVVNVLSDPHRRYLTNGGLGFMLGDGRLHYGPELITEAFYRIQWTPWLQISPDVQFVANPGYNRARGPIPVWGVRVHAQL